MITKLNPGRRGRYIEPPLVDEDVTLVEDHSTDEEIRYVLRVDGESHVAEVFTRRDSLAYSCWRVEWYREERT
jgi:hypothetical protein